MNGRRVPTAAEVPSTIEKVRATPILSTLRPKSTCAMPQAKPKNITLATAPGVTSPYPAKSRGTVANAASRENTSNDQTDQMSQMFSHDHRVIHFIGSEKLAFAIAAIRTNAPPNSRSDTKMPPDAA